MERFSDGTSIESMLAEMRPAPRPEFAAGLDARAAAGFARGGSPVKRVVGLLRATPPRRILAPIAASAVVAIAVATALVSTSNQTDVRGQGRIAQGASGTYERGRGGEVSAPAASPASGTASAESGVQFSSALPLAFRDIERSAQITLLADPEDVAADSQRVFAAVRDAHGIVLRSNTTRGPAGRAGASFTLRVPSNRLGDALAALSAIDEVSSRHDATADITAPTVDVGQRLHESRARIDSLLAQLASAETEAERETLEAELHGARRQAASLESQLARLRRRAHYSTVSVRIESGNRSTSPGGAWGIGDALGSAGRILGVAAGVTLVGLAVLAPLLLVVLIAWVAYRIWLRQRRERALS